MKQGATRKRRWERGQILVGAIMLLLVLAIIVPAMVQWAMQESRGATKNRNTTVAFNLAQAAVDRGMWMVKSTTITWAAATAGTVLTGYNFDTTYTDIPGGTYRIKITPVVVGGSSVTIVGEGRDNLTKETRAISAVYLNQTIYSPIMTQGITNWGKGLGVFWGPLMSQGNITMCDDSSVNQWGYPRKFARGVVQAWNCPSGVCAGSCPMSTSYPRDVNGPMPPNTGGAAGITEWTSLDTAIPELPIIDFPTLKSSATASFTWNVYGCVGINSYTKVGTTYTVTGVCPWDTRSSCQSLVPTTPACGQAGNISGTWQNYASHTTHFGNPLNHPAAITSRANNTPLVWFYDGDLTLSGNYCSNNSGAPSRGCSYPCSNFTTGQSAGFYGTLIVKGNLTIDTPGEYFYNGHVPANAWQDQQLIVMTSPGVYTADSSNSAEYPADTGLHQNAATFNFGPSGTWTQAGGGGTVYATVGMRGFIYVGGNITFNQFMDTNGAIWIQGNMTSSGAGAALSNYSAIYFNDQLNLPTLNVILMLQSWKEVQASATVWN